MAPSNSHAACNAEPTRRVDYRAKKLGRPIMKRKKLGGISRHVRTAGAA